MSQKYSLKTVICFWALLLVSSLAAQDDDRVEQIKQIHESRIASSVVDISGTVTDVEGNKLDGVELSVSYVRPKDIWATDSETVQESMLVNGVFSIKKKNIPP